MSEEQKKEKLSELRKKEQEIQDILAKKTKELKKICLREAVRNNFVPQRFLTGILFAFKLLMFSPLSSYCEISWNVETDRFCS